MRRTPRNLTFVPEAMFALGAAVIPLEPALAGFIVIGIGLFAAAKALRSTRSPAESPDLWALLGFVAFMGVSILYWCFTSEQRGSWWYVDMASARRTSAYILGGLGFLLLGLSFSGRSLGKLLRLPKLVSSSHALLVCGVLFTAIGCLYAVFIRNSLTELTGQRLPGGGWWYAFLAASPMAALPLLLTFRERVKRNGRRTPGYIVLLVALNACSVLVSPTRRVFLVWAGCAYFFWSSASRRRHRNSLLRSAIPALLFLALLGFYSHGIRTSKRTWDAFRSDLAVGIQKGRGHGLFHCFAFVLNAHPHRYDYLHGYTLLHFVVAYVPRPLWPNKPVAHSRVVAMQTRGWDGAYSDVRFQREHGPLSFSGTLMGEGYANFGPVGAFGMVFLFGYLCSVLRYVRNQACSVEFVRILQALTLMPIFVQQRGDVAMINAPWIISILLVLGASYTSRLLAGRRGWLRGLLC